MDCIEADQLARQMEAEDQLPALAINLRSLHGSRAHGIHRREAVPVPKDGIACTKGAGMLDQAMQLGQADLVDAMANADRTERAR